MNGAQLNSKLSILFVIISLIFGCSEDSEPKVSAADFTPPIDSVNALFDGAPDNSELGAESKADETFPLRSSELLASQSPVKSQGSRGVCSTFSTVALMEHLYIAGGTQSEPDFSEQYLQWSVKFEQQKFPNTSASNSYWNLQAIHRFGISAEQAWPYEEREWNETNDPECGTPTDGTEKPTRCYTNGSPPDSAINADKFKLPEGRFISTRDRDIKAHIHNKKTAVILLVKFFKQAWNHGASPFPVSSQRLADGFVLYPNEDDKALGLQEGGAHSVLIVGWDDELEAPSIDKEGNPVIDANGEPVIQKGFFLFKNSWGTDSFGVNNEKGDGYGWISMKYVEEFGSAVVSDFPNFSSEVCGDNIDNDGNGKIDCDDDVCNMSHPTCVQTAVEIDLIDMEVIVPDNDAMGRRLTFEVEAEKLTSMIFDIDIKHNFSGDISLALTPPSGGDPIILLKQNTSNAIDDIVRRFIVEEVDTISAKGEWTLQVTDHFAPDGGVIRAAKVTTTNAP